MEKQSNLLVDLSNVCEISIRYRNKVKSKDRPKVSSSGDAWKLLFNNWDKSSIEYREEFKVMLLNRANKVLGISCISKGGITGTVADIRIIFQTALKAHSQQLIVSHNHPSANLQPSEEDKIITKKIKEAGLILDITLLDHIIVIPDETYFSFADEGIL